MNRKIKLRKKEIKLRKNFLPTLLITVIFWFGVFSIIYWVSPFAKGAIPLFFFNIFFAFFFTLSIILANTRRGVLFSFSLTLFLILRYFELGGIVNLLLLIGLAATIELYITRRSN